ncbi:MAG: hypothetical protein KDB14_22375, partial [Planctomycetales bacterium]|nr:hypothetical protein [Planctomycetales bacterium]
LGLSPSMAIERAVPTLASDVRGISFETVIASIFVARNVAPLLPNEAAYCVAHAIEQAEQTTDPFDLQDLAYAIAALAGQFEAATELGLARRTMYRAASLTGQCTDLEDIARLAKAVAIVSELDVPTAQDVAGYIIGRALDVIKDTSNSGELLMLPEITFAIAGQLDEPTVRRTVARSLDLAAEATDSKALQLLAETIAALADKLDPASLRETAGRIVERAIRFAEETTSSESLLAAAEAIAILAAKGDPTIVRVAAKRTVERALDLAERTTNHYELDRLAKAIGSLLIWHDDDTAADVANRTVVRVLTAGPGTLLTPRDPASAIAALAQYLDVNTSAQTAAKLLELGKEQNESLSLSSTVRAVTMLANRLPQHTATISALSLLVFAEHNNSPSIVADVAEAVASLSMQIDLPTARNVARRIVGQTTQSVDRAACQQVVYINPHAAISAFARTIVALASHIEPGASRAAAASTVGLAIHIAAGTKNCIPLRVLAEAIATLGPLLPGPAAALVAIELLKLPLGGDGEFTETLVAAITNALNRPDLLRPFPEQSFWAAMQHLAELKAANPDWGWLDLARPPLPPDDLVESFRRLCANPPDLPKPAET